MQYPSISKYLVLASILGLASFSSTANAIYGADAIAAITTVPFEQKNESYYFVDRSISSGELVSATVQGGRIDNSIVGFNNPENPSEYIYQDFIKRGSAFASADLRTGQLKTSAELYVQNNLTAQFNNFEESSSTATIFDRFTTYQSGNPFIQSGNNQAKFIFDISGNEIFNSPNFARQGIFGTFLTLEIQREGRVSEANTWLLSDPALGFINPLTGVSQFVGASSLIIPDNKSHIEYSFNLENATSFDWSLTLSSRILFGDDLSSAYGLLDYSHTVNTSYIGPEGTTTVSESGLFSNILATSPVPETDSYAMLLAGLGVLGFVARRKKHA